MGVWGELDASWKRELAPELASNYFRELAAFVDAEYAKGVCYPPGRFIFEAFNRTPFDRVKAVIIGQDPYHGPNQAHGLAFSVLAPTPPPPSLLNIYRELEEEYACSIDRSSGDLAFWADQGVLLLNSTLTVAEHMPGSHQKHGWERFTDAVVSALNARRENIVFMLWGAPAQKKGAKIDKSRHLVLAAPHPSPLSAYRGFFGCGHFRAANDYLVAHGFSPINWFRP